MNTFTFHEKNVKIYCWKVLLNFPLHVKIIKIYIIDKLACISNKIVNFYTGWKPLDKHPITLIYFWQVKCVISLPFHVITIIFNVNDEIFSIFIKFVNFFMRVQALNNKYLHFEKKKCTK